MGFDIRTPSLHDKISEVYRYERLGCTLVRNFFGEECIVGKATKPLDEYLLKEDDLFSGLSYLYHE